MPGSYGIPKIIQDFLINRFKEKPFDKGVISAKIKEIQHFIEEDELLIFLRKTLDNTPKVEPHYLATIAKKLLSEEFLSRLFVDMEFSPPQIIRTNAAELKKEIHEFITTQVKPKDLREQNDKDRFLRRLDSISRVLSFHIMKSPCTAITIHQGQMIAAANVGDNSTTEEIQENLAKKITLLKRIISDCKETGLDNIAVFCTTNETFDAFTQTGGIGVTESDFIQSLTKIIHVVKNPSLYPFSQLFMQALLESTPATLLTANKDCVNQKHYLRITGRSPASLDIDKNAKVHDLHAEQLIYHYVTRLLSPQNEAIPTVGNPLRVGISKLCCATCHKVLTQDQTFLVRGTHQNYYEGTVDIRTGVRVPSSTPVRGPTNLESSIFHSDDGRQPLPISEIPSSVEVIIPMTSNTGSSSSSSFFTFSNSNQHLFAERSSVMNGKPMDNSDQANQQNKFFQGSDKLSASMLTTAFPFTTQ